MKRKFSLNLAPVKVPMKPEPSPKHAPEPSPAHSQSHRKHYSKDSISTLSSPYINRRPLDPQTERELRRACALILQNFKPSDHDLPDKDPKLDFKGLGRRRDNRIDPSDVTVRKPTGAPADLRGPLDARKHGHKSDLAAKSYPDLAIRANTARRRGEPAEPAERDMASRKLIKSPTSELPRSATARTETDSDGLGTPLTGSTDTHLNHGSTAPTSAAVTSGRSSTRMSRQYESAAAAADAQAAEWMRHEREKRKQQQTFQPQPTPQPAARPPSRARSIRDGLREYIFPGSSINTSQSQDSLRAGSGRPSSSQGPRRSGSSSGWRSWGLQRMSSSRSNSRPGTSRARLETQELDPGHQEVNLNRELPPLPSLDSWRDSERPKNEHHKSQAQGAHIATLMRPQDQKRQEYAAGIRQQHRRSGSDTLAVRYGNAYPQASSSAAVARSPSHVKLTAQPMSPRGRASSRLDTSRDFDEMVSALSGSRNLDEQLKFRVSGHTHQNQPSTSTLSHPPASAKMSTDAQGPPNFSRKISMDVAPPPGFAYPNIVHVAHQPKDEQKSRLRKVFSGWMLKKEKKDDWMQRIEKEGVREGVMIQDEAALPPVVRY